MNTSIFSSIACNVNKEFKMLGKEEIKEQAILRGMQNGRLLKFYNSKFKILQI